MELKNRNLEPGRDYTYNEIAQVWDVCVGTVKRWFENVPGLFNPTKRTVRIPGEVAIKFRTDNLAPNGRKKPVTHKAKKKSRKVQQPAAKSRRR